MNIGKVAAAAALMTLATAQTVAAAPVSSHPVKAPVDARVGAKRSHESSAMQGATTVLVVVAGAAAVAGVVAAAKGGNSASN